MAVSCVVLQGSASLLLQAHGIFSIGLRWTAEGRGNRSGSGLQLSQLFQLGGGIHASTVNLAVNVHIPMRDVNEFSTV